MSSAWWSFPRGKPQFYADSPASLARALPFYAFGRRRPPWQLRLLAVAVRTPGLRQRVALRTAFDPPCGGAVWRGLQDTLCARGHAFAHCCYFRSQWRARRFAVIGHGDAPGQAYAQVQPIGATTFHPATGGASFRVPRVLDTVEAQGWRARVFEPLPPYHRAVRWEPRLLERIAEDVSALLGTELVRAPSAPDHWAAMHGDLTPSNLREDRDGEVWLIDWEDAAWAPPGADALRFGLAALSLGGASPESLAVRVRRSTGARPGQLAEAAAFWLAHPNFRAGAGEHPHVSAGKAADLARVRAMRRALELLAQPQIELA